MFLVGPSDEARILFFWLMSSEDGFLFLLFFPFDRTLSASVSSFWDGSPPEPMGSSTFFFPLCA